VLIREAEAADADAVAAVHVRAWQAAYRGLLPDAYLDALRPQERASRYTFGSPDPAAPRTMIAAIDGAVAGFASFGASRDPDAPHAGELFALYVDPGNWRSGVGGALLHDACERLCARGHEEALLWVLAGNERAARFYLARGWRSDGAEREEDPRGVTARVRRYRRSLRPA